VLDKMRVIQKRTHQDRKPLADMNFTSKLLRFAPISNHTVRADFNGGGLSSDLGPLLLKGVDHQIGLSDRLAAVLKDKRHSGYVKHTHHDLLKQRIFQIACGYEDGNDSNALRKDPMFRLGVQQLPFGDKSLASGSTISRFEHSMTRQDIYRLCEALVEQYVASFATPPQSLVLDLDHSEDQAHGQQPLAFYNHFYQSHCYLPLMIFDGRSGALVAAILRPGKRPTGAENAMLMKRILKLLRKHFPQTHILVRGDSHFSSPEMMHMMERMTKVDFIFGLAGNARLHSLAEPTKKRAKALWKEVQSAQTNQSQETAPQSVRLFAEFNYAASSWKKEWRVILKAEEMAQGENPRFIVTSWAGDTAQMLYEDLYCARGQMENFIKHLKGDLASDRTSCKTFLANFMRLIEHAAAYVLHQQLRTEALQNTALAQAQPSSVINKLFKIAVQVKQTKNRIVLHLPSACAVKDLLHTLTERLFVPKPTKSLYSP